MKIITGYCRPEAVQSSEDYHLTQRNLLKAMSEKSLLNSADNTLEINISPESISYAVSDDNQQVLLRQELNIPIGPATDMGVFEHFFNQPELQILGENVRVPTDTSRTFFGKGHG